MHPATAAPIPAALSAAIDAIARETLGGVRPLRVFLFGSRAKGTGRSYSDYDIAISSDGRIEAALLLDARERCEELPIFQRVDLVDLADAADGFRDAVEKEGVLLYDRPR